MLNEKENFCITNLRNNVVVMVKHGPMRVYIPRVKNVLQNFITYQAGEPHRHLFIFFIFIFIYLFFVIIIFFFLEFCTKASLQFTLRASCHILSFITSWTLNLVFSAWFVSTYRFNDKKLLTKNRGDLKYS